MRCALRRLWLLAVCLSVIPLWGCDLGRVIVLIHDFDSAAVEGVTFWRDEGGSFVLDGQLIFTGTSWVNGQEYVSYDFEDGRGVLLMTARAPIYRDALDPDEVTAEFYYMRVHPDPTVYKVSSFNGSGESPLSLATQML